MINSEIIAYAKDRITLEIGDQDKKLISEIAKIKAEMASRGMIRSGNLIGEVQAACVRAVNERADIVWKTLHRGITTIGVQYEADMEQQLKAVVEQYFPEHMDGLKYRVTSVAQQIGMPDIVNKIPDEVGNARHTALARVFSEIRLFVMTLKKPPVAETYTPQLNIYNSNIGAVQTGHKSVSNVNMQINAENREALIKALDAIAQELTKIDVIPGHNKADIVELVNEGKAELTKANPNLTKIISYLPIIGSAVDVVANLKPAYDALKTASALIGVPLP